MSNTATPLVCLLATLAGLNACAPQSAEIDASYDDISAALAVGDHQLARQIGAEFLGREACQGGGGEDIPLDLSVDGFLMGGFADTGADSSLTAFGRLITEDLASRYQIDGERLDAPIERIRGQVVAETQAEGGGDALGFLSLDYGTAPSGDNGTLRGTWTVPVEGIHSFVFGHWFLPSETEGRFFGEFHSRAVPVWGEGVRVRVRVDGESHVVIDPQQITLYNVIGDAPGHTSTEEGASSDPVIVNGEAWYPSWPEEGANADCDCHSNAFYAPGDVMAPAEEGSAEALTLAGRGQVKVRVNPSDANGHTTVVTINDREHPGAAWYEIEIGWSL